MSKTSPLTAPPEEQMRTAQSYAQLIGKPSSLFSAGVRTIRNSPTILKTNDPARLKRFAFETLHLVIKVSPTLKTTLFRAAEELEPDLLDEALPLTFPKLTNLFQPDDLCAILALTYYYRRMMKICAADEWERILPKFNLQLEFGAMLGDALPELGRANGMLACGIRVLAQAMLMTKSIKPYREIRRRIDQQGKLFDDKQEIAAFDCSHLQIASHLISEMGYGVGPRTAFGVDLYSTHFKALTSESGPNEAEIIAWRHALLNAESLHAEGVIHNQSQNIFTYEEKSALEDRAKMILTNGKGFHWLSGPHSALPEDVATVLGITAQLASTNNESQSV